jgi:hypothetical protein
MTSPAALAVNVQDNKISRHLDPARDAASAADYPHHEEKFGQNLPQQIFGEIKTDDRLKGTVACLRSV